MPTFITSTPVSGEIGIQTTTTTGFWRYNHDGSNSSVFTNGFVTATVQNDNGEFTIISCNAGGSPQGNITYLYLNDDFITSFDGTGLTSLISLDLSNNTLTSFDGTVLSSLNYLNLNSNSLTSFDGTGLTSLLQLNLHDNLLTSFDGTLLSSLESLSLDYNQLTSFNGPNLSNLTQFEIIVKSVTKL